VLLEKTQSLKLKIMTRKITQSSGWIPSVLSGKMKLFVVAAALVSGGLQAQTVVTLTTARQVHGQYLPE
jgi:hypothetical protein